MKNAVRNKLYFMDIKRCLHLFMSMKYNLQVTNYFDLVDISTWLWSKWDKYMVIVGVSFRYNYTINNRHI